jgi:hypothetical protein
VYSRQHAINPAGADLSDKHQAKFVPPKPNRLMADVDASLMQQIFDIAKRKWAPNIQHHCKADDLKARLEISKWAVFCYQATLGHHTARLKPVSSDSAPVRLRSGIWDDDVLLFAFE